MKNVIAIKTLEKFVDLLRAKAIDQAKKSEGNDNQKGYWQAGQAEGFGWAADHLGTLLLHEAYEVEERCR